MTQTRELTREVRGAGAAHARGARALAAATVATTTTTAVLVLALALAPVLVLLGAARPARAQTVRVLKQHDLTLKRDSPTFIKRGPVLVDRGRLVHHGSGLWHEQHRQHFFRVADGAPLTAEAPLAALLTREESTFPGASGVGFPQYMVQGLLFYDTTDQQAGLLLSERGTGKGSRRLFYLHWDLAKQELRPLLLGDEAAGSIYVESLGYDPQSHELYATLTTPQPGGVQSQISVVALSRGKRRAVTQVKAGRTVSRQPSLDGERMRAFLAEYSELDGETAQGHLVDLRAGTVRSMPIPHTTYGVAWHPDGRTLYLYSSKLGRAEARSCEDGKLLREARVGGLGHHLAWLRKGTLVLFRNAGLQLLDARTLAKRAFIPSTRLYPGFSHVEGSFLAPGRLVMVNGWTVHLVELK